MLELFSRIPPALDLLPDAHLTPLPSGDETSSLSAILLDDVYYEYLHGETTIIQGIHIANPECLIPLKAKAWLDLTQRKARGESVDTRNITKHSRDILTLFGLLPPTVVHTLPVSIANDISAFLSTISDTNDPLYRVKMGIEQLYGLQKES